MLIRARTFLRKGATLTLGGTTAITLGLTSYAYTENGAGFRREVFFWSKVFPIVLDYYFSTAENSPLVQYQKLTNTGLFEKTQTQINDDNEKDDGVIRDDDIDTIALYKKEEERSVSVSP